MMMSLKFIEIEMIVKNSQRVLRLNDQYENHPYVEEFTKGVVLCLCMKHMF